MEVNYNGQLMSNHAYSNMDQSSTEKHINESVACFCDMLQCNNAAAIFVLALSVQWTCRLTHMLL